MFCFLQRLVRNYPAGAPELFVSSYINRVFLLSKRILRGVRKCKRHVGVQVVLGMDFRSK